MFPLASFQPAPESRLPAFRSRLKAGTAFEKVRIVIRRSPKGPFTPTRTDVLDLLCPGIRQKHVPHTQSQSPKCFSLASRPGF